MKKGEKNQKKDSMNLQKMYEQRLTPQRKVEAFRRYVIKLKQQRNFGRDLSYYEYMQADIRLFREEALYMKGLQVEYDTHVRLSKEIRCLEEMTDEQILCYYALVKRFQQHVIGRVDMRYARYYLLELSNLIYQDTPREACEAMFSFQDALEAEAGGKISGGKHGIFPYRLQAFHACVSGNDAGNDRAAGRADRQGLERTGI